MAIQFLKSFGRVRRVHSYGEFYGVKLQKEEWACPYRDCGSEMVVIDLEKYHDDWTVADCKRSGILSLAEIRKAQKKPLWDWREEEKRAYFYRGAYALA